MVRTKRKRSKTGIYHIMLRGINRQNIFQDDNDREKFIRVLKKAKDKGQFSLFAYCLMNNHVHLLIKENEEIGRSIQRITVSYVQWYNNKYGRVGHLFQNRYKSEVVEDDSYLLVVLRYIHQNPVKAKICKSEANYKWSSYNRYIDMYNGEQVEIDTDIVENYFNTRESFEFFMGQDNDDKCLEYENKIKYSDKELKKRIEKEYNIEVIKKFPKKERDKVINNIKIKTDASIRQLSRVLGVGRSIVEKAVKKMTNETSP